VRIAALALLGLATASVAEAAPLFGMLDASTMVVRGRVDRVTPYESVKLVVYRVAVERVLKGDLAAGESMDLAQELLFESLQPYFTAGAESLILAVPLQSYSSFRKALPEGRYWRWTERLDVAAEVAAMADPTMTEAAARYLAIRDDAEATADFLVATIVGSHARLRRDALALLETRRELAPLLDDARLASLQGFLADERQPLAERALVLVNLARVGAPGLVTIAERHASGGPLQAPAIDALVSLDRVPPEEQLMAASRNPDDATRVAAGRGLAKLGTPAALDRLDAMLTEDRSDNVAVAILNALAAVRTERAVRLLVRDLGGQNKARVTAAAQSLGRVATPEAVAALGKALESGAPDAQGAAAFALRSAGSPEATEILHTQEKNHPDPKVRRLCRIALGESGHEH
jgi:HEAT repeat protein